MTIEFDERDLPGGWVVVVTDDRASRGRITRHGVDKFAYYRQQGQLNPSCIAPDSEALKQDIVAHPQRYF